MTGVLLTQELAYAVRDMVRAEMTKSGSRPFSQQRRRLQGRDSEAAATVMVRNDTGTAQEFRHVVGLGDPLVKWENEDVSRREVIISGEEIDTARHGNRFGVLLDPCGVDEAAEAVVYGYTWAVVDIVGLNHGTCGLEEGRTTLVSGKSGADILYKPTGTGEQRCLVAIGLGGGGGVQPGVLTQDLTPRQDSPKQAGTGQIQLYSVDPETGDAIEAGDPTDFLNWSQAEGALGEHAMISLSRTGDVEWLVVLDCTPS